MMIVHLYIILIVSSNTYTDFHSIGYYGLLQHRRPFFLSIDGGQITPVLKVLLWAILA